MMDKKYFRTFSFSSVQIEKYLANALQDLDIAQNDVYLNVRFNYAYNAFIKACIALLSFKGIKVRAVPGHHIKLLEMGAELLEDSNVVVMGDLMRVKRNRDLYDGGIAITETECSEFISFVKGIVSKVEEMIGHGAHGEHREKI